MNDSIPQREKITTILGWAAYLGCSWTWCIGMFLPVLLVRDFGTAGFWVFAVPNVIGAAAMGWVLRDRQASESLVNTHRAACIAFSLATLAFQSFFIGWLITWPIFKGSLLVKGIALLFFFLGPALMRTGRFSAAIVILIVSAVSIGIVLSSAKTPILPRLGPFDPRASEAIWLAPVCLFGFGLCPYLDITFHLARQQTSRIGARIAFILGFCAFFLAMILYTLIYAHPLNSMLIGDTSAALPKIAWFAILTHLLLHLSFVMSAHYQRIKELWFQKSELAGGFSIAAIFLGFGISLFAGWSRIWPKSDGYEFIYRTFMSLYGLVFPTYVWLFMVPIRGINAALIKRNLMIFGTVILFASPFYWWSFVLGKMEWASAGVIIVLLSRIAIRAERSDISLTKKT